MSQLDFPLKYNGKIFQMRAVIEYQDNEKLILRVHDSTGSLLIETNYPATINNEHDKRVQRILREGNMKELPRKKRIIFEKNFFNSLQAELDRMFNAFIL